KLPLIQLIEGRWAGSAHRNMLTPKGLAEIASYADGIGPSIHDLFLPGSLNPSALVVDAKKEKLVIHAYTLRANKLPPGTTFDELAGRLFAMGVDGIFTDHVDLLVQ